jgi:toxin ParE1/3/4
MPDVRFAPDAVMQLETLLTYIAERASPAVAHRYIDAVVVRCESLGSFPHRGTPRDDIRPGMRTMSFRRRTTIAYAMLHGTVYILGVFHGGQDFAARLRNGPAGITIDDTGGPR